jgi:urease accessory protein
MPETFSGVGYGLGFVAATVALHATGIGLGLLARSPRIAQIGGAATAHRTGGRRGVRPSGRV